MQKKTLTKIIKLIINVASLIVGAFGTGRGRRQ